ncbi:conserved hypothetical protein, partial [Ricinus communis]
ARDLLAVRGAVLHQPGGVKPARALQCAADARQVAADLHDDQGLGRLHAAHQLVFGQGAGHHAEHVVAPGDGLARGVPAAHHAGDAGHHVQRHLAAFAQPGVQMHEGAVEEGVALAQHHHLPGLRQRFQAQAPVVVEARQQVHIGGAVHGQLGGHRVLHGVLGGALGQQAVHQLAGLAGPALLAEERHLAGAAHQAVGLDAHEFGVARAQAHADNAGPALAGTRLPTRHGWPVR